jgi:hypothetical protein
LDQVKAKVGLGAKEEAAQVPQGTAFPSGGAASFPVAPAPVLKKPEAVKPDEAPAKDKEKDEYPSGQRDWNKMITRVKADVERICNFLEALAKHPRGLQKYHEEAVRTVHDSWIDREGEQSLRRWVRSECARIWPHKFAAIEAEKDRARADIAALEELFGAREAEAPAAEAGKGGK